VVEGTFIVKNKLGLHARPAASFVKKACEFTSTIFMEKDGTSVNGKSIMGLLMLACPLGSKITLKIEGSDEQRALQELGQLIEDGFNET
jgi:phosphocarrier protein HPr